MAVLVKIEVLAENCSKIENEREKRKSDILLGIFQNF